MQHKWSNNWKQKVNQKTTSLASSLQQSMVSATLKMKRLKSISNVQSNMLKDNMKNTITLILSKLFPFKEINDRTSVFIQESWLEKTMRPIQLKDYLWTPSK